MKQRYFGLDLIRIIAVLFVIGVHSLSRNGYYTMPLAIDSGLTLFVITMLRWLFYACVPIFIIITGYLKKDKKLNKSHFSSLKSIVIEYLLVCVLYIVYCELYLDMDLLSVGNLVKLLSFDLMPYAWYLQLYVGLFLLIPFLNVLYNNLESKKSKMILIGSLVGLTGLATTINPFVHKLFGANLVFTNYVSLFPFALYFLGAFIAEYQVKIGKVRNVVYLILVLFIQTVITYVYCNGGVFDWTIMNGYGNVFTFLVAGLVFCLVYNISLKGSSRVSKLVAFLSGLSFKVYLVSYFVDLHFYDYVNYLDVAWYKMLFMLPISLILHYGICVVIASILELPQIVGRRVWKLKEKF